jgi:EAL domain-containing protein (putative c-di-GMP-specific phosphodiesterase class I)
MVTTRAAGAPRRGTAHWLELEITESTAMGNKAAADRTPGLHALQRGRRAHRDRRLRHRLQQPVLPADAFPRMWSRSTRASCAASTADERKRALVGTMAALSHDLGYRVVAEGVETETSRAFLRSQGCDEAQGYLFARPMPPQTVSAVFREPWRVAA